MKSLKSVILLVFVMMMSLQSCNNDSKDDLTTDNLTTKQLLVSHGWKIVSVLLTTTPS